MRALRLRRIPFVVQTRGLQDARYGRRIRGPLFLQHRPQLCPRHPQRQDVIAEGMQGEDIAPGERTGREVGAQAAGVHEPDVRAQRLTLGIGDQVAQHGFAAGRHAARQRHGSVTHDPRDPRPDRALRVPHQRSHGRIRPQTRPGIGPGRHHAGRLGEHRAAVRIEFEGELTEGHAIGVVLDHQHRLAGAVRPQRVGEIVGVP